MWIHEYQSWPNFTCDAKALAFKLADIRHRQGRLLGRMEGLGFELKREASLSTLTNDVVKSSAIEGEHLSPKEVRSSIARRLRIDIAGLIPAGLDVEGIVEMTLDATRQFSKPLTKDRLFDWHAALFPTEHNGTREITVGDWRKMDADPMQVISGPIGKERVHFRAPSAERLEKEMQAFLAWFENEDDSDPVIKAGIAHLWFVTIHPFEDGNGRIARAIGDMALARSDGMQDRFYSLSSQIEAERKHYYDQLERQQRATLDITNWLLWFLNCLGQAIANAETALANVLYKTQLWDTINQKPVNDRQRLIINRMLKADFEGFMNTSKYAKLAKCSNDTALRDIQKLKARGIFIQNLGGGRSTSYRLPDRGKQTRGVQNLPKAPMIAATGIANTLARPTVLQALTNRWQNWRRRGGSKEEALEIGVLLPTIIKTLKQHDIAVQTAKVTASRRELEHMSRQGKVRRGQALDDADFDRLPEIIARPEAVLYDTRPKGKDVSHVLLYVFSPTNGQRKGKVVVEVNYSERLKVGDASQGKTEITNSVRTAGYVEKHNLQEPHLTVLEGVLE